MFFQFANGIDERPLVPASTPAKSYSEQQTFNEDQTDEAVIEATLKRMADHLIATVRAEGRAIRTLTVKVRYNDFAEDQCGESLAEPTDLETDLYGKLTSLLRKAWRRRVSLRMVSLKLSNVYDGVFRSELALDGATSEARRRLSAAVDELRQKLGNRTVLRGHDFVLREERPVPASAKPKLQLIVRKAAPATYIPLNVHSYYSFLDSTLSPAAIVELAKQHRLPAIALTDPNLHGAVEFQQLAKAAGVKPLIGAELHFDGQPLWLYVQDSTGAILVRPDGADFDAPILDEEREREAQEERRAAHVREARPQLYAPYARGERDPYLLASLGLYERAHGDAGKARQFLEAAFGAKAKRFAARHQEMKPGASLEQRRHTRARGHELFEVIEQQQDVPVRQVSPQPIKRRPGRESPKPECLDQGVLEESGITDRGNNLLALAVPTGKFERDD